MSDAIGKAYLDGALRNAALKPRCRHHPEL
jgi:hypothetical protein